MQYVNRQWGSLFFLLFHSQPLPNCTALAGFIHEGGPQSGLQTTHKEGPGPPEKGSVAPCRMPPAPPALSVCEKQIDCLPSCPREHLGRLSPQLTCSGSCFTPSLESSPGPARPAECHPGCMGVLGQGWVVGRRTAAGPEVSVGKRVIGSIGHQRPRSQQGR